MKRNYFNFKKIKDEYLLTNDFGEYVFLKPNQFYKLARDIENLDDTTKEILLSCHMIYEESDLQFSNRMKYELRYAKSALYNAASLHIFVLTTACNLSCIYCQANKGSFSKPLFMTKETALKAVDIALQSPAHELTFEFQGGEPLLNFDILKEIVLYTEANLQNHIVHFSVVTNLTLLDEEILAFFKIHHVSISTSIDGPRQVHDLNRPMLSKESSFEKAKEGIEKIRKEGVFAGAIQTTTRASLKYPVEIAQTYASLGFNSLFVRPLTPLGKASKNWQTIGYSPEDFLEFYRQILDALIDLNLKNINIRESTASMLLQRISGESINYMELRSPCGAGIGQIAYYADGRIFTCDEGRMLAEMGDDSFQLGNTDTSIYKGLVAHPACKAACQASVLESIPSCCDCVYQPYCGVCPVVNFALQKDIIERSPNGYRCQINKGILDILFEKIRYGRKEEQEVLNSWRG